VALYGAVYGGPWCTDAGGACVQRCRAFMLLFQAHIYTPKVLACFQIVARQILVVCISTVAIGLPDSNPVSHLIASTSGALVKAGE
jgi:hypothetical protein